MKKILLISLLVFIPSLASAYQVLIDSIGYNLSFASKEAEVLGCYILPEGSFYADREIPPYVKIPSSITYNGIEYTVTGIGDGAFESSELVSIDMPNTITHIGYGAFINCEDLTSINIPNSVVSIGDYAFCRCTSLTTLKIPESVSEIGEGVFNGCSRLNSVDIPYSITSIGYSAFFECNSLESIQIPNSVTSIGDVAFSNCSKLETIVVGDNVAYIGDGAFEGTQWYDNLPNGLIYAGKVAYKYKGSMPEDTKIVLNEGTLGIADYAFIWCKTLKSISFPNSLISIGEYAFCGCSSLTSIIIPNNVSFIGKGAFNDCKNLADIRGGDNVTFIGAFAYDETQWYDNLPNGLIYAGKVAYKYKGSMPENTEMVIKEGTTSIGAWAFFDCVGLTSVKMPTSVTNIGVGAFEGCKGLSVIDIPNSVTSIGDFAFDECSGLTSIIIPNNVKTIGEYAFSDCDGLTSLIIGDNVSFVGEYAFMNCSSLKDVIVTTECMVEIGDYIFSGCEQLEKATFHCSYVNSWFKGVESIKEVILGDEVIEIGYCAFMDCSELAKISLGKNVSIIGAGSFSSCNSLSFISLPKNVTIIEESAFESCREMTKIVIPKSVKYLGPATFAICTSLTDITIPDGITEIGAMTFFGCLNLTSVSIPSSVTEIGVGAFSYCISLSTLSLPEGVTEIKNSAFINCNSLFEVYIPNSIVSIGEFAFSDCGYLNSIHSRIIDPFEIFGVFDNEVFESATLYVPIGKADIYKQTPEWHLFRNIIEESSYENFFVEKTYLSRELRNVHLHLEFSNIPHKYASLEGLVKLSSNDDNLDLLSFTLSNNIYDIYFGLPKKEGTYTLTVANSFINANGVELDQNRNNILREEDDIYSEDFIFGANELYIVSQSPTIGQIGTPGYTDVVFNDVIHNIPLSSVSMYSPSGKEVRIKSIEYLETPSPARHRIGYDKLEEDGIYNIIIGKGLKSDNGKEMRYDQQLYIELPCADLQPISVIPQNGYWVAGQKQSITYTLKNVGSNKANGPSVDILYLSPNEEWSSEAIELFRDTTSINIEPEKDLTRTITVIAPLCIDGKYYLILKTNVAHTFNELSYDDNTLSSDTISLSVDWLSDTNNKFTLARGESRLFKVLVDTDKNIEISDNIGIVNLFSGCGGYPNTDEPPKNASIALLGSPHFPLTYYLLVSNNEKDQAASQQCELNTREFELDFTRIEKTEIVKYKKVWIPIEMIGCTDMPVFYLVDDSGVKTECLNVYAKTETSFYAQFDTEPLQVGNYGLYVECAGKTGMLQNAVTIKQEVANPKVEAKLILPETSRIGSTITAYIDYKNVGNVDVPAPLFVIAGTDGSKFAVDGYDVFSEEGHFYGMNENGVLSAILPGESNRIAVQIKIPSELIYTADYKLKTITEGCDGMDEHFYLQWLDVDPDENPGCYTDEEWNEYCNRLRRNVGDNWHTFIQAMATVTDLCFASYFAVHDATYLYDILKGYDLAEIMALMAEEKENRKNAPARNEFVMPGTIYIYEDGLYNDSDKKDGDPWKRLVDPSGSSSWVQSSYCINHPLNKSADYIFIAHGMNNTHKENWIKIMAYELYKKQKKNIICVDWGEWSYGLWGTTGIWPDRAASYIDTVVWRLNAALKVAFDEDIDLSKFHFIGHSHGAHVCGRLSNLYKGKSSLTRLTCLDMSEELDHMGSRGVNIYHPGDLRKRFNAEYIDYYKSSIICGTEWLVGDDNFILAMNDNYFVRPISSNGVPIDGKRHGYAYEWFSATINKENCEIGYQWDDKGNPRLSEMRERHGSLKRWSGVINGKGTLINKDMTVKNKNSIIENYSNFVNEGNWNYPEPWYNKGIFNPNKEKAREWDFFNAFASTIDYHPADIIMNKKYIQAGTKESLRVTVSNNADNLSIPLHDRQKETRDSVCNVLYISKDSTGYIKPECNRQISRLKCNKYPLYYLAESNNYVNPKEETSSSSMEFCFNVSRTIWELLGGNDRLDTINCCICVVTGVNKSNKDYKKRSNDSVQLWKGELRPQDNCIWYPVTVRKPGLSCDAGADRTITLQKNQDKVDVNVAGTVVNEGDYVLSYAWKEGNSEFSAAMEGTASLGVGTHTLTFEVEASDASFAKARRAPSASKDTIFDDVIITVKPYTPGDEDDESTETASSWDPNEKVGIRGAGGKSCIRQGETMEYTIYFENDAEKAQLAAQTVTVIDTLDQAFDLTTFEFTGAEASNTYIDVPLGKSETTILTDMRPDNDLILKTEMKLDIDKRIVKVVYSSLDTLTYEPTLDVFAGFLPPNDFTHRGEGHFSYRVKLKDDVADGYVVKNQAHIFFDYNDEIATNITHHPVDNRAPISSVDGLPNETREDSVMVSWSGYDQGAGIRYYDIYRSKNGGNFELWKSHTSDVSAIQYGVKNDIYKYFSVATDSLGFVEEMKTSPEATVKFIGSSDGITLVENDPKIDVIYQNEAFIVTGAEGSMFNVYDLLGQIVVSKQLTSHYERIPFDRKGVYLVSVDNRVGVLFEKKLVTK